MLSVIDLQLCFENEHKLHKYYENIFEGTASVTK
jgi:hypothetical protein